MSPFNTIAIGFWGSIFALTSVRGPSDGEHLRQEGTLGFSQPESSRGLTPEGSRNLKPHIQQGPKV